MAAGVIVAFTPAAVAAPLLGWVTAATVFVSWTWTEIWPQDATATAEHAQREDPGRAIVDGACLLAAATSLIGVGILLFAAGRAQGSIKLWEIALAIVSVLASWALVHTVYTLRYARTYFGPGLGSIDFNEDEPPCYSDFAYVAITVGLTFQISDTDLRSKVFRRLAIRHMLISYLLGAVIVAITINLVAGLSK